MSPELPQQHYWSTLIQMLAVPRGTLRYLFELCTSLMGVLHCRVQAWKMTDPVMFIILPAEFICCAAQATTVQHWQLRDLVHADGEHGVFFVQSNRTMRYDTKSGIVSPAPCCPVGFLSPLSRAVHQGP